MLRHMFAALACVVLSARLLQLDRLLLMGDGGEPFAGPASALDAARAQGA